MLAVFYENIVQSYHPIIFICNEVSIMNIPEYESYHEKKHHFDADFPYNTYLCSIPLDFASVPVHWHDEMEIIYIKKGRGLITVDLKQYVVSAGSILFIIPGQLHSIEQYELESMEYENIIFDVELLGGAEDLCAEKHHFQARYSDLQTDGCLFERLFPAAFGWQAVHSYAL